MTGQPPLHIENSYVSALPGDAIGDNYTRQVLACYSHVQPRHCPEPQLITLVDEVADLIGFDGRRSSAADIAALFSGNRLLPSMMPYASNYGGHQFGHWAGQLGDGRAINLGEAINGAGERYTVQLKGAGRTPYSRQGDGFAVLRSSIRELLCSEAMHHLGVPTTRALSLVTTGDMVMRDLLYDGNPAPEPGAVLCRVAPTFTRFGNFQLFAARGETTLLQQLLDYTIRMHFPELGTPDKSTYLDWFEAVCRTTADLMVHWMRVGFVHGVMNSDNMSILGLTIDYGPYGWLEAYDPEWTPNITDKQSRRYCFGKQPQIAAWNLARLAEALMPLIGSVEPLQERLRSYSQQYESGWQSMMRQKLGLEQHDDGDEMLITQLLKLLPLAETDMTIFYRSLPEINRHTPTADQDALIEPLYEAFYNPEELAGSFGAHLQAWLIQYIQRLKLERRPDEQRRAAMHQTNPKYVLRNYLAQQAIERAETGDYSEIETLMQLLKHPYDEQPAYAHYAVRRPEWARELPGCSMLSCSS